MGAFNGLLGSLQVKEEHLEPLKHDLLKLMTAGGMVGIVVLNIFDKEIYLYKDLKFDEKLESRFHYNYLSDESWESAYICDEGVASDKVGCSLFAKVIYAGYTLCSLYSETYCVPHANYTIYPPKVAIAWINQVLKRNYRYKGIGNFWKLCDSIYSSGWAWEEMIKAMAAYREKNHSMSQIMTCFYANEGINIADKAVLEYDKEKPLQCLTFMQLIQALKDEISLYKAENSDIQILLDVVCMSREEKIHAANSNTKLKERLISLMLLLNAVVVLKAIAEEYEQEFWQLWGKYREKIQDWTNLEDDNLEIQEDVGVISTPDYLEFLDSCYIWCSNELVKKEARKNLINDDLLYYYKDEEPISFSEDLESWFVVLRNRHREICENNPNGIYQPMEFTDKFVAILAEAETRYHRVAAFEKMFFEFNVLCQDIKHQAAIKLLEELIAENLVVIEKYEPYFNKCWDFLHPNLILNDGRRCIKRYLALLANKELRNKVLGF